MTETSGKRIMIIEDSVDMQVLLKTVLESKGYNAVFSSNGEDALDLLESCTDLPKVILLDLQMPIMDGYTFLEARRKISKLQNIPVIVMSGNDEAPAHFRATISDGGASEVLLKPVNMKSVIEAIERNSYLH
jgi:two-component system chemotaxis sensor kinase CheA